MSIFYNLNGSSELINTIQNWAKDNDSELRVVVAKKLIKLKKIVAINTCVQKSK